MGACKQFSPMRGSLGIGALQALGARSARQDYVRREVHGFVVSTEEPSA